MNKILIIEDDFNLRQNIGEILETEGYQVGFADNGKMGLELLHKFFPDLIISDIMMPLMNGFQLLEELMKTPETASIPLIFLSAKAEPENLRKGMKLGADDYLFKPFIIDDLLQAIETRLKKRQANDLKIKEIQDQITLKIPHELRTPLVPILGYAEMIENEDDLNQIKDMVGIIKKSGKVLHSRIEKFLMYKDLIIKESSSHNVMEVMGRIKISSDVVIDQIEKLPAELNARERVKINVEQCSLPANELYLGVIIGELIENGLKFSNESKSVICQGYRENNNYKISVTDMGKGMSENEIKALSVFRKYGEDQLAETGLGLGLAIVKKITELCGLNLTVKSEINKFTTCEVCIPI